MVGLHNIGEKPCNFKLALVINGDEHYTLRIYNTYCHDHLVRTSPRFHNNSDVRRHIHTHTHRPLFAEIQVVSSALAVQQKKADGKIDSFP